MVLIHVLTTMTGIKGTACKFDSDGLFTCLLVCLFLFVYLMQDGGTPSHTHNMHRPICYLNA